jgi:hypothetical protein
MATTLQRRRGQSHSMIFAGQPVDSPGTALAASAGLRQMNGVSRRLVSESVADRQMRNL